MNFFSYLIEFRLTLKIVFQELDGLLNALNDEQVRDLFAYLRSTQLLPPRRK